MFIQFNEEQTMLLDSAGKYLHDNYSFDRRQAILREPQSFCDKHWQAFADLGWLAMTLSEDAGGLGGGALETMILCEQFGKYLVLEPYLESVLLVGGLLELGAGPLQKAHFVEGLITGKLQGAVAYLEANHVADPLSVATTVVKEGDRFVLRGQKVAVSNGPAADVFIVSARENGNSIHSKDGISLFLVDKNAPGLRCRHYQTHDGRGASELHLDGTTVGQDALIGGRGAAYDIGKQVYHRAIIAVAAEAVGAMDALLTATVTYTKQRQQFGQPIAGFQVLRHRMVDMYMEIELSRSLLMATAWKLDNLCEDAAPCVTALKAKVGKASRFVSHNAIQLHGAIATTNELNVGHYFKRLAAISVMFGLRDTHLSRYIPG